MPQGSDDVTIIALILGIAVFILVALLAATFAILRSGVQMGKERSSTSLAENLSAPIPKDELKEESILPSPDSEVIIPTPEDGQKNTFTINQIAINLLRIPIAVALMTGLILILMIVNPIGKIYGDSALARWFWSTLMIYIEIAGGGAMSVRIAHLSWRQTVLTALLTGAGAMLISRFEISPLYVGLWDFSEGNFQFYRFLIGTLAVSAPVFLLPLCDPLLRQNGLAPSRLKVVIAALGIIWVMVVLAGLMITWIVVPIAPIAAGVFIGVTCLLLGIGVALSLFRPTETIGAELGGVGLILLPISSFVWLPYLPGSFS